MGLFDFLSGHEPAGQRTVRELAKRLFLSIGPSQDTFETGSKVVRGRYRGALVEIHPGTTLHLWFPASGEFDFQIGTRAYVPMGTGTAYTIPGVKLPVFKISKPVGLVDTFISRNSTAVQRLLPFIRESEWEIYFFEKGLRIDIEASFSADETAQILNICVEMFNSLKNLR